MILTRLRQLLSRTWGLLLAAMVLFVVALAISRTQVIDLDKQDRIINDLRQLKEGEAVLNRQVLESRFALSSSYDELVHSLNQLTAIQHRLRSGTSAIYRQGWADVDQGLDEYQQILAQKASLVEQFKSENAVLRNSLRYFPIAVDQLAAPTREEGHERTLPSLVHRLLWDILRYNLQADQDLKSRLVHALAVLRQIRPQSPGVGTRLNNILEHAQTILEKKDRVDGVVRQLLSLPSSERIDSLSDAYNRHYRETVRRLSISRFVFYFSSVLLLSCVAYVVVRLQRSNVELERRAGEQQALVEELSRTQEQLIQSQKMEAVGRLAGGIAHDFNNLLTVITSRSQLLLDRLRPEDPLRRDVELIQKTVARATSLTKQLLAFSRKQVLQPKVLDLNEVVANMESMLRRLIGEDIDLVRVTAAEPGRVKADPVQLEQVIMNLAVNARDAMPEGGRLTLEIANVYLDEAYANRHVDARPGSYVMLGVSDTGFGMDAETQARVFEPFFTTKEPGKGTGLGLSTVYGIVKQSGGNIWVYSEPERGTTFKIYLPRLEETGDVLKPETLLVEPQGGTETILLVEDEEELRAVAHEILEMYGYTVLEADNPTDALLIAERQTGPIHLLLTDVVMPTMSGRELARRLAPLRSEMAVLYMSGYTDNAIVHHGVLDPGTAFLEKPFNPQVLARKVREVLNTPRSG